MARAAALVLAILVASPVAPAAAFDWTGFYAGVHAGYGIGTDWVVTTLLDENGVPYLPSASNSLGVAGAIGGVQLGYNQQVGAFVLGVEGDVSLSGIAGQFQYDTNRDEAIAGGGLKYLASIRGRVGVAADTTLFYATAGFVHTFGTGFADNVWSPAPAVDLATGSDGASGYVLGAGVEHAITDNISLRSEYLYYGIAGAFDMRSSAYPAGTVLHAETRFGINVVRAGLNAHF